MSRGAALLVAASLCGCAGLTPSTATDDVFAGGRLAARLERAPYDAANARDTCKVYHALFAADGRAITKGLGGEFDHHRGLFVGWNQVTCGGRHFDFWHCHRGESQRFCGFAAPAALGVAADSQVVRVEWCDRDGMPIVRELRSLRARALDDRTTAFDVALELSAADQPVQLGGDPQHSGHQFRAPDLFAPKDAPKVRYVRPPGAQAHGDDVWTGCDWIAAILPLPGRDVTVVRGEDPGNPPDVRWSTRDYGRFGATFTATLTPGRPLRLRYEYVVALGALDASACAELVARARRR